MGGSLDRSADVRHVYAGDSVEMAVPSALDVGVVLLEGDGDTGSVVRADWTAVSWGEDEVVWTDCACDRSYWSDVVICPTSSKSSIGVSCAGALWGSAIWVSVVYVGPLVEAAVEWSGGGRALLVEVPDASAVLADDGDVVAAWLTLPRSVSLSAEFVDVSGDWRVRSVERKRDGTCV